MAISQSDFAIALELIRPSLQNNACRIWRCTREDAEDRVGEAIVMAMTRLEYFRQETGIVGLHKWLYAFLVQIAHQEYRGRSERVPTVPMEEAVTSTVCEVASRGGNVAFALRGLTRVQQAVLLDWLDGYNREETAVRYRLHRNTVALRLEEAFGTLRLQFSEPDALLFSLNPFASGSRVAVYRKPTATWLPWRDRHPPEARFHAASTRNRRDVG